MEKENLTYESIRAKLLRENAVSVRFSVILTLLMGAVLALFFLIGWYNAFRLPHMLMWIGPALLLCVGILLLVFSLKERGQLKNSKFTVVSARLIAKDERCKMRRGTVVRERRFDFGRYGNFPVSDKEWERYGEGDGVILVLYPWKELPVRFFYSATVYEYTA